MAAAPSSRRDGAVVYLKHPGIGDLVWHLPFLRKAAEAGGPVTVLCRPSTMAREVLANDPDISAAYLPATKSNLKELTGCLRAFRALKPRTAWILDASSRPAMAAHLAGVEQVHAFGFGRRSQERWITPGGARLPAAMRELHPVELYCELARAAGLGEIDVEPRLQADPALAAQMQALFAEHPRPWVFLGVGSTTSMRCWPADHFGELARRIGPHAGTLFWFGGPGDRETARMAMQAAGEGVRSVDVTGRFSLPQSMALLSLADLYVGNDSGPLNLAAALGVRAFGLFGASVVNNSPRIELIVRDRFFPGMRGITPQGAAERILPALEGA